MSKLFIPDPFQIRILQIISDPTGSESDILCDTLLKMFRLEGAMHFESSKELKYRYAPVFNCAQTETRLSIFISVRDGHNVLNYCMYIILVVFANFETRHAEKGAKSLKKSM